MRGEKIRDQDKRKGREKGRKDNSKGEAVRITKRKEEMKTRKGPGGEWTVMERKKRKERDWGRKDSVNRNKREQQKSEKESSKENLAEDGGGRGRPPRSVSPSRSSKCGWKPSVQSTSPVHNSYTPEKTQIHLQLYVQWICVGPSSWLSRTEAELEMFGMFSLSLHCRHKNCDKPRKKVHAEISAPTTLQNMFMVFTKNQKN